MMRKTSPGRGGALAFALALALLGPQLWAQERAEAELYTMRSSIDWKGRLLSLDVELKLAAAGLRLPEGRLTAERMIERDLPGLAKDAVLSIQADSFRTIADAVADGSFDSESLVALAGLARFEHSSFSKDLRSFLATYSLRIDAIAALFLGERISLLQVTGGIAILSGVYLAQTTGSGT